MNDNILVPKAEVRAPQVGKPYFIPNIYGIASHFVGRKWEGSASDRDCLEKGLVFQTADEAEMMAIALIKFSKSALRSHQSDKENS